MKRLKNRPVYHCWKKANLDCIPERAFYSCRKDANAFTTRRSRSTSSRLSVYSSFDCAPGKREKNCIAIELAIFTPSCIYALRTLKTMNRSLFLESQIASHFVIIRHAAHALKISNDIMGRGQRRVWLMFAWVHTRDIDLKTSWPGRGPMKRE